MEPKSELRHAIATSTSTNRLKIEEAGFA